MFSSTLSLTSALVGVGGQHHTSAALAPGKETRYPLYRRLSGRQGRVREVSPHTGIQSPDRPACSEPLHRMSYPGPNLQGVTSPPPQKKTQSGYRLVLPSLNFKLEFGHEEMRQNCVWQRGIVTV